MPQARAQGNRAFRGKLAWMAADKDFGGDGVASGAKNNVLACILHISITEPVFVLQPRNFAECAAKKEGNHANVLIAPSQADGTGI